MSTTAVSQITNFTVVAFEPDLRRAEAIQRIVSERAKAGLTLVDSKDRLFEALRDGLPDLILLPALLPPADESQLFEYLRELPDSRHLEVLVTPYTLRSSVDEAPSRRGWRRFLPTKASPPTDHDGDPRSFGERVVWALQCAKDARRERAEQFSADGGTTFGPCQDRRVYRRFSPSELPWLQRARIKDGPKVRLLDLSAGGVLVESSARMRRDSEGVLELTGPAGESTVPFRVVRWLPYAHDRALYLGACEFLHYFEFDRVKGPVTEANAAASPESSRRDPLADAIADAMSDNSALAPFFRRTDDLQGRDPRFNPGDVPWLSSANLTWGPEVDVLNISKTGMLVETSAKFTPGTATEFQLNGPDAHLSVPARVVRSEVAAVGPTGVKYHAAVKFSKEVRFPGELGPDMPQAPKALADLMTEVLSDVTQKGTGAGAVRNKFLSGLRKHVPARQIDLTPQPVKAESGSESIYFTVPGTGSSPAVLQATFESDYAISDVEFRFLQAAAVFAGVVLEFEPIS